MALWVSGRRSLIACVISLLLGFFSMGALGAGVYYAVSPVLAPAYGLPDDWHGDWVWAACIGAGMAWSFSFLAAGWAGHRLLHGCARWVRVLAYCGILWACAAVIWAIILLRHA